MCVCVWQRGERDFVEVSFNLKHERRMICINCMLSGGLGVAAILRKDMRGHEKKKKQKARSCIVGLQEESRGLNKGKGENW